MIGRSGGGFEGGGLAGHHRRARAIGMVWVVLGSLIGLIGGANLAQFLISRGPDDGRLLTLSLFTTYGTSVLATGFATRFGSTRAAYVGLVLSAVPIAFGYVVLPLALVALAARTIRASRPVRPGRRVVPGGPLAVRLALIVAGGHLGALAGAVPGSIFAVAAQWALSTLGVIPGGFDLGLVGALSVGAIGGAAGGGLGGLVAGAFSRPMAPRARASVHLLGALAGMAAVAAWVWMIGPSPDRWAPAEAILFVAMAAGSGGLGASAGSIPSRRLATAFEPANAEGAPAAR